MDYYNQTWLEGRPACTGITSQVVMMSPQVGHTTNNSFISSARPITKKTGRIVYQQAGDLTLQVMMTSPPLGQVSRTHTFISTFISPATTKFGKPACAESILLVMKMSLLLGHVNSVYVNREITNIFM